MSEKIHTKMLSAVVIRLPHTHARTHARTHTHTHPMYHVHENL